MDDFDIELVEGAEDDPFSVLGDAGETSSIASVFADLAKDVGSTVAAKQAAATAAENAKKGIVTPGVLPPGAKPPSKPSFLTQRAGGLPVYGWFLVGGIVIGVSALAADLLKPAKKH